MTCWAKLLLLQLVVIRPVATLSAIAQTHCLTDMLAYDVTGVWLRVEEVKVVIDP